LLMWSTPSVAYWLPRLGQQLIAHHPFIIVVVIEHTSNTSTDLFEKLNSDSGVLKNTFVHTPNPPPFPSKFTCFLLLEATQKVEIPCQLKTKMK
jgi:hypothetical protein